MIKNTIRKMVEVKEKFLIAYNFLRNNVFSFLPVYHFVRDAPTILACVRLILIPFPLLPRTIPKPLCREEKPTPETAGRGGQIEVCSRICSGYLSYPARTENE